jgi:hypothetical protein
MRECRDLFLVLFFLLMLKGMPAFGEAGTDETNMDKSPLINLRQFPLPPSGIGYHMHNCPDKTQWMLCKVYEMQSDGGLKPYSGQLNWDAYDANGREVFRSCCAHEGYIKIDRRFMNPGDVYFIVAEKDGEVLLGVPHANAEPNVAHFSAIPIWTYNDFVLWCPLHYKSCLDCNKLQAGDFSELSTVRGGPRLHSTLNIYIPAKSSVIVTKSSSMVAEIPVYYIISNKKLSAYRKASKRTDENGKVDFNINKDNDALGFFALYGGCLHPSTKNPDSESIFEIELPGNAVTLTLKKDGEILRERKVVIADVELNATISVVNLISDELGQVKFIPPSKSQYRVVVFDRFQQYVSLPIQPPTMAEMIVFDITSKNERSDNNTPTAILASPDAENTNQTNYRRIFPEPRQFWQDFQFTSAFGGVEDRSRIREFNVHEVLQKSRTPIDNRLTLAEMLFFERILYSIFYTELSKHAAMEKQSVQRPILAPSIPSQ